MNTHLGKDTVTNFKTEDLYKIRMAEKIRDIVFRCILLLFLVFCSELKCCSVEEKRNEEPPGIKNSSTEISSSKQFYTLN